MMIDTVEKLFHEELKDIYDAEHKLIKALPKMAKAAKSEELKEAFQKHLVVTKAQVGRLDEIFKALGSKPTAKTCMGMKGLLEEGDEAMSMEGSEIFTDLALIGAARRVEHYEMAAYLSLQDLAEHMEMDNVSELVAANLAEENDADEELSALSMTLLESSMGSEDEEGEAEAPIKEKKVAAPSKPAGKARPVHT